MAIGSSVPSTSNASRLSGPALSGSAAELAIVGSIIVAALYFGQAVFVPLALAVILSFVLASPVRALRRVGLPNTAAVVLVVVVAFGIIFSVGTLITQQVGTLVESIPQYQYTLKQKIRALREIAQGSSGSIERASDALKDLRHELEKPESESTFPATPPTPPPRSDGEEQRPMPVEVRAPETTPLDQLQTIIGVIIAPLVTAGVVVLFVLFLLLQRVDVRDRAIRLLGSNDLEKSTVAMDDAGQRLSRFFLTLTAINAAYGVIIGTGLWIIGVPSPILWGVLAMLMRFVPFVGGFIAAAFPVMLAAAVDPGWTMFAWTLALYVVGEITMGNVIEPVVQGQSTGLSPLAIILAAAFWTLLWGPIGLLLAIPLTVVLVVLGRHVERLEFLHVLLGDTPPLTHAERLYQRMLAGDPAEAVEQAEKLIKQSSLLDFYDEVFIDALRLAQADVNRGTLGKNRLPEIRETAEIIIDTLSDHDVISEKSGVSESSPKPIEGGEVRTSSATEESALSPESKKNIALFEPQLIPPDWCGENAILCVAGRTALDEVAASILVQLLTKSGIGASVLGPQKAKHGALQIAGLDEVRLVCVSALDVQERSAHARLLMRRIRRTVPEAYLLCGFWKLDPDSERAKSIIESITANATVSTLRRALSTCLEKATGGNDAGNSKQRPVEVAAAS